MSETPTPRMNAACDNLDDCLDWEQIAYRVAAQGQELERELTAERAARERAEAERDALREYINSMSYVLCDPEGAVCVAGSDGDRAVLQAAIDAAKEGS